MNGRLILVVGLLAAAGFTTMSVSTTAEPDVHPTDACSAPYHISHANWDFCWQQDDPRAQGIELNQVYFHDQSVLWKIGVPFSMTKYDVPYIGPYKDTLGSPGAGGHPGYGRGKIQLDPADCPRFYGGTGTLLNGGNLCVETRDGPEPAVAIWGRYDIFNYRFMQGYKMDSRGHFEPFVRMGGLLIDGNSGEAGANHFHHLLWRSDFDIGADGGDVFEAYHRIGSQPISLNAAAPGPVCQAPKVGLGVTGWCTTLVEGFYNQNNDLTTKWRIKDPNDTNGLGRAKGFEFDVFGTSSADEFGTMDIMVVEYKGDSRELGYEVPTGPVNGDTTLYQYFGPPEVLEDPVVWLFQHAYHDTRDEDRGSMSYHEEYPFIQPRSFFAMNPGEGTFP